ncbi:hypothetical protein FH608_004130 [Nonomuraea phyllanthi]|uniref:Uncharacterized protein n=1 Tax=Nonomuraea phyllanthi TaxID=2219224 RepID=A0A5C4WWZ1_9ACTN|nr:hypothetical protein [Nonomuraea phyllanthi]KAB8197723.1 hypothetical protein FH608_004130 [Nonomuraea phyllanthi]
MKMANGSGMTSGSGIDPALLLNTGQQMPEELQKQVGAQIQQGLAFRLGEITNLGRQFEGPRQTVQTYRDNVTGSDIAWPGFGLCGMMYGSTHTQTKKAHVDACETAKEVLESWQAAFKSADTNYDKVEQEIERLQKGAGDGPGGPQGPGGPGGPTSYGDGDPFSGGGVPSGLGNLDGISPAGYDPSDALKNGMTDPSSLGSVPGPGDIDQPDFTTPDTQSPDFTTPDAQNPDFTTPDMQSPDFTTPDMQSPDLKTPDFGNQDGLNPNVPDPGSTNLAGLGNNPLDPQALSTNGPLDGRAVPQTSTDATVRTGSYTGGGNVPNPGASTSVAGANGMPGMPMSPMLANPGQDRSQGEGSKLQGEESDWIDDLDVAPATLGHDNV